MTDRPAPEIEVTDEMVEAGGKALAHELWKLDPFAPRLLGGCITRWMAKAVYDEMVKAQGQSSDL